MSEHVLGRLRAGYEDEKSRREWMLLRAEEVDGQPWVAIIPNRGDGDHESVAERLAASWNACLNIPVGLIGAWADPDRMAVLLDLLTRADVYLSDMETAPDDEWFRDYFIATRQPMVLTEDGWVDPKTAEECRKEDPEWEPIEVLTFGETS